MCAASPAMNARPGAVFARHLHAQVPEAEVVQVVGELGAHGPVEQLLDVQVRRCAALGKWCVEEPVPLGVDPPEEGPVALEVRRHHAVGGPRREPAPGSGELRRAEDRQRHDLVEVGAGTFHAALFGDDRPAAVAAHDVVGFQRPLPRRPVHRHPDALVVLLDLRGRPAEPGIHLVELRHPPAKDLFGAVLGESLVALQEVGRHLLPTCGCAARNRSRGRRRPRRCRSGGSAAWSGQPAVCSARPQKRKCSMVRWVRFWPFGMRDSSVRRSTTAHEMPRSARSIDSATPTGPPPTTMT